MYLKYLDNKEILVCKNQKNIFGKQGCHSHKYCSMPSALHMLKEKDASRIVSIRKLILMVHDEDFEDPYYDHKSRCVCCNEKSNLTWHHVIPYCYMRNAASQYKRKHAFADIVILCKDCHEDYEKRAMSNLDVLLEKCNKTNLKLEKVKLHKACSAISLAFHEKRFFIPDESNCQRIAKELKIKNNLEFMGRLKSEVLKYFRSDQFNLAKAVCENLNWDQLSDFWRNDFSEYLSKNALTFA